MALYIVQTQQSTVSSEFNLQQIASAHAIYDYTYEYSITNKVGIHPNQKKAPQLKSTQKHYG